MRWEAMRQVESDVKEEDERDEMGAEDRVQIPQEIPRTIPQKGAQKK